MRSRVLIASLAMAILGSSKGAFAQQIIEGYADDPSYYEEYAPPESPAYGFQSDLPVRPANCGEFRYWNGYRCVDARVAPPDFR
jgi:hypothetical protein